MQSASMQAIHDASTNRPLPPGQRAIDEFPRFGGAVFAMRPIKQEIRLSIAGAIDQGIVLTAAELATLPRVSLTSDFHCAAGWSHRDLKWTGFLFKDVWEKWVVPRLTNSAKIGLVVLRCQDGYRTALPLSDLLATEVLIADRLNDQPLSIEHGAPIRLIAPAHYGYKSAKHLAGFELRVDDRGYVPLMPRLLDHPRARVALEERGRFLPGWLLRWIFRPFIQPIIRKLKDVTPQGPQRDH
ncbi:molybdopterin-dependent oxidoreductase [Povalibacter uvarum]|nr:molybdopterin-dependent oxidoreductase [Povalibacter uvarum]